MGTFDLITWFYFIFDWNFWSESPLWETFNSLFDWNLCPDFSFGSF